MVSIACLWGHFSLPATPSKLGLYFPPGNDKCMGGILILQKPGAFFLGRHILGQDKPR